ncbi:MAG TPA: transposase [Bacillota bacterium]|nr:transposase [Bacillota bacterium]HOL09998.1 transposase [Bacillota bacterium]HPO97747.1 transposase [Bacillota bacterium]
MKRRKFTDEFKQQIIREAKETRNCALVARNYDLLPSLVAKWVREADYPIPKGIPLTKETKEIVKQNLMLKKLLAEKELENAILQDLLKKTTKR